ncbi:hypothetical protein IJE86_11390, partial [bacterium]|nr:hypothetical protein [bacterium]
LFWLRPYGRGYAPAPPLKNNVILKECEARLKNLLEQKSFRHSERVKRSEESHRILAFIPRDSSGFDFSPLRMTEIIFHKKLRHPER